VFPVSESGIIELEASQPDLRKAISTLNFHVERKADEGSECWNPVLGLCCPFLYIGIQDMSPN
jgi:hypothetical protein